MFEQYVNDSLENIGVGVVVRSEDPEIKLGAHVCGQFRVLPKPFKVVARAYTDQLCDSLPDILCGP